MQKGVGPLLAMCRDDAELPQRYIAVKAKCQQAYVSMVERGEREAAGMVDLYARETGHPELCLINLGVDSQTVEGIVKERIKLRKIEALMT